MAAYVIGIDTQIASNLIDWLKTNLLQKRNQNDNGIDCLEKIGYSRKLAAYALKINKFSVCAILIVYA